MSAGSALDWGEVAGIDVGQRSNGAGTWYVVDAVRRWLCVL